MNKICVLEHIAGREMIFSNGSEEYRILATEEELAFFSLLLNERREPVCALIHTSSIALAEDCLTYAGELANEALAGAAEREEEDHGQVQEENA